MKDICEAFKMELPEDAYNHIQDYIFVKSYGSEAYGHRLYTWDEGERYLIRCRRCGGLILVQASEHRGLVDDDVYVDYFPVESEDEAELLNEKYNGWKIEGEFNGRYLMLTNGKATWAENKYSISHNSNECIGL